MLFFFYEKKIHFSVSVEINFKKCKRLCCLLHSLFSGKLPKNYDPNAVVDAERWLPLKERSYYRGKKKRKGRSEVGMCQYDFLNFLPHLLQKDFILHSTLHIDRF